MNIQRKFTGTSELENVLLSIISGQIDKILAFPYDETRADAIPSETETEGMVI
ncbi:hypothetical protein [Paenibacillus jamilae]|uniref:hypothetical protein n=1 Tax=Paenibacillus jamilae TaxID=114136 RepID=UPI000B218013|nr:hypothetical protein [Paenibacillus jamilae]